jgi:putative restriction endonuclease
VDLGQITAEAFQYSLDLLNSARERFRLGGKRLAETGEEYKPEARSVAFRRVVVKAYNHTCAMCRIRVMTPEGRSAVVAAHIVPWSESYNDDPRNGLSLCGLHHWVFDEGLAAITEDYLIRVSKTVSGDEGGTGPLLALSGQKLYLPEAPTLWPAEDALDWHRSNTFRKESAHRLL